MIAAAVIFLIVIAAFVILVGGSVAACTVGLPSKHPASRAIRKHFKI